MQFFMILGLILFGYVSFNYSVPILRFIFNSTIKQTNMLRKNLSFLAFWR